jgi:hypothetical protein
LSGLYVIPVLIESGFRASLPVGVAWAATRWESRCSAATRHFIWACAIAIAVLLPLTTILMPRWIIGTLLTSIASEYHWPARMQTEREVIPLRNEQLDALVGVYSLPPGPSGTPVTFEVTRTENTLYAELKGLGPRPKGEIFPSSATSFFNTGGLIVNFTLDSSGRATSLKFGDIVGIRKQ